MNVTCIICSSRKIRTFIHQEDLPNKRAVLRCSECGLVFFQSEGVTLDDTYWDKDKQMAMYEEAQVKHGFAQEFKHRLEKISKIIEKGRLLDIGCGRGEFLNIARESGWQVYGVELSRRAADFVKQKYGFDVFCGTVEDSNFKDEFFDVITLWDVLEHIQRPRETLRSINMKLKRGGLLVIKTPDENGLFKRIARSLYCISAKKLKSLLKYVYYLPHYFSYSLKTIKRLLKDYNFRIVQLEKDRTNMNFACTKIKYHYAQSKSKKFVLLVLPAIYFLMDVFALHNKMVVYAKKEF